MNRVEEQSLGTVRLGQVIQVKRLRILTMVMDQPTALEYYYFVGLGARRTLYRSTTDDTEYTEGEHRFSWGLFPCVLSVPWFYGLSYETTCSVSCLEEFGRVGNTETQRARREQGEVRRREKKGKEGREGKKEGRRGGENLEIRLWGSLLGPSCPRG